MKQVSRSGLYYLNSGSAGRHQNLIWCIEICGDVDTIVSWSRIDGKLARTPGAVKTTSSYTREDRRR